MTLDADHIVVATKAYQKELPNLIKEHGIGKFALFVGAMCIGAFPTYRDALVQGYSKDRSGHFLVRQISTSDEVVHIVSPIEKKA